MGNDRSKVVNSDRSCEEMVEEVRRLLDYDPETGIFTWKPRPRSRFDTDRMFNSWNSRFAGKVAGSLHKYGYIHIGFGGKLHKAHRLAWMYVYGYAPKEGIDHINHCRDDNRIANLRLASHSENHRNRKRHKHNKSGVAGVVWHKRDRLWCAAIGVNGKSKVLGYFKNKNDAIKARQEANCKYGYHENHGYDAV